MGVGHREEGPRAQKYGSNEPTLKSLGLAVWPVGLSKDLRDIQTDIAGHTYGRTDGQRFSKMMFSYLFGPKTWTFEEILKKFTFHVFFGFFDG